MKGLKGAFQTDADKTTNGVWFDYPEAANSDGTVPGFKLARLSVANPAYAKALSDFSIEMQSRKISDAEDKRRSMEIFVEVILKDWRNIQPNDDGNNLEFSREEAFKQLSDPEMADMVVRLRGDAAAMAAFKKQQLDAQAKN